MSNLSSNISIVILAAGASKRMQSPKQLLKWGNSTLLGHTIGVALKTKNQNTYVVLGANYQDIKENIAQSHITILNNENWKIGLGSSIAFATSHILETNTNCNAILFMLADQPFIDQHFLNELVNQFVDEKGSILATSYEENKYGVPVIFDNSYFEELSKLNDDRGAKYLLKRYKSNVKVLVPPVKNVDLDFKEDYTKLYNEKFKSKEKS